MVEPLITPETFEDVARQVYNGDRVDDGVCDSGFVLTGYTSGYVGLAEGGGAYMVGKITKRTSTVGQNEPRMQTRQNTSVSVEFRRVELGDVDESLGVDDVEPAFEDAKRIDTGYINGYRVTPLPQVLDDIFKWYDNE